MTEKDLLIQELRAENARLKRQAIQWVDPRERMPRTLTCVLVCLPADSVFTMVHEGYAVNECEFYIPDLEAIASARLWAEMPEAPEDEK